MLSPKRDFTNGRKFVESRFRNKSSKNIKDRFMNLKNERSDF
jgi:hypothetical protein